MPYESIGFVVVTGLARRTVYSWLSRRSARRTSGGRPSLLVECGSFANGAENSPLCRLRPMTPDAWSGCAGVSERPRRLLSMLPRLIGWREWLAVAPRRHTNGPRPPTNERLIEGSAMWMRTAKQPPATGKPPPPTG